MNIRKIFKLMCGAALLAALACHTANAERAAPNSILRFASGAPDTALQKHTKVIAASLWENSRNRGTHLTAHQFGVAVSSAGSGSNLKNLSEGRVEFAAARADLARAACANPGAFGLDVSTERIRLVTHLAPALIYILVRKDIAGAPRSFQDLAKRSISIGLPGAMAQHSLQGLFEAHGVAWHSLNLVYSPVRESYRKLVAGQLDAIVIIDQPESPQLTQLLLDQQNQLLGLDAEITQKFIQQSPYVDTYRVDTSTLEQYGKAVPTMAIDMLLLGEETVGPESVSLVLQHVANSAIHQNAWPTKPEGSDTNAFRILRHPAAVDLPQSSLHEERSATALPSSTSEPASGGDAQ